jgi:hypothetical protein
MTPDFRRPWTAAKILMLPDLHGSFPDVNLTCGANNCIELLTQITASSE